MSSNLPTDAGHEDPEFAGTIRPLVGEFRLGRRHFSRTFAALGLADRACRLGAL
jgi:hypothetical protein